MFNFGGTNQHSITTGHNVTIKQYDAGVLQLKTGEKTIADMKRAMDMLSSK